MRAALKKKFRDLAVKDSTGSSASSTASLNIEESRQSTSDVLNINSTERLWNEAYDLLKRDEPKLMNAYELLLAKELNGDTKGNTIATNASERRAQMQEVIDKGLTKTESEAAKKKSIGAVVQILNSVKNVVGAGLQPSFEATLAWTALTAALPVSWWGS